MNASEFWIRFVLSVLATWRITHLLVSEDGPGDVIIRLRARWGDTGPGRVMDCFGCASMWVAVPFAFAISHTPAAWGLGWLALSGAAFLLERAVGEPLVLQRLPDIMKGDDNDVLRSQEIGSERTDGPTHRT